MPAALRFRVAVVAAVAALAGLPGCGTDEAVERDTERTQREGVRVVGRTDERSEDAAEEAGRDVEKGAEDAGREVEKGIEDVDGR